MLYAQFPNWINLLLLGSCLVNKGAALKCYICGGEEEDSFPCSEFQVWDARYTKECERNSNSCRISLGVNDKKILSRSCETIKLEDCKAANSIEYCYCSKSLCNQASPVEVTEDLEEIEEDFSEEGSGIKNVDHESTTHEPDIYKNTYSTKKTAVNLDKAFESNVIPSDHKHSSNCNILRSHFYLSVSLLSLPYVMITKQY